MAGTISCWTSARAAAPLSSAARVASAAALALPVRMASYRSDILLRILRTQYTILPGQARIDAALLHRACRRGCGAGGARRSDVIHQLVDGFLPGPCDAAKQHLPNLLIGEIGIRVALHPDERAGRLPAGDGVFVSPDLRRDLAFMLTGTPRRG